MNKAKRNVSLGSDDKGIIKKPDEKKLVEMQTTHRTESKKKQAKQSYKNLNYKAIDQINDEDSTYYDWFVKRVITTAAKF